MPTAERQRELERLVQEDRLGLLRAAGRILGNEHEAEDVLQETLVRVLAGLDDHPPRSLRRYLWRATRLNALKHRARRRVTVPLEDGVYQWQRDDPLDLDPLTLERALLQLPPAQQAVLRMRYYMDMSFAEVGKAFSISINTAASRCRYALAKMRRLLSQASQKGQDHE